MMLPPKWCSANRLCFMRKCTILPPSDAIQCILQEQFWYYIILQFGCILRGCYRAYYKAYWCHFLRQVRSENNYVYNAPPPTTLASNKGIGATARGFVSTQCTQFLVFTLRFKSIVCEVASRYQYHAVLKIHLQNRYVVAGLLAATSEHGAPHTQKYVLILNFKCHKYICFVPHNFILNTK